VSQLQLALEPLLLRIALREPRIFDGRPDLVGHCADQLAIIQREAISADSISEIHDAHAPHIGAWSSVGDGNTEK
jgi:hypothetical protein